MFRRFRRNSDDNRMPDLGKAVFLPADQTVYVVPGTANAPAGIHKSQAAPKRSRWSLLPRTVDDEVAPLVDDLTVGLSKSGWKPGDSDGW